MRFLQTEWHRHERDRNAWEIDRQEMKARIASLEGQARRADATQKALKKYVAILEKKVKDQAAQLKGAAKAGEDAAKAEKDRAALVQEKLRREFSLLAIIDAEATANIFIQLPPRSHSMPMVASSMSIKPTMNRKEPTSSLSWISARPSSPI